LINDEKDDNVYNSSGKAIQEVSELWMSNAWVNSTLVSYTYDNSENPIQYQYAKWVNQAWLNSERITYTYDASNNCTSNLTESWFNLSWINSTKALYTFDNNGNCINGENYKWIGTWELYPADLALYYDYNQNYISQYAATAIVVYEQVTGVAADNIAPAQFNLMQNYPNPFNPSTTIKYQVPEAGIVSLKIYDILGSEVKSLVNEEKQPGTYSVIFNAHNLASGVYYYRIQAGSFVDTKKLILLK